MKTSAVTSADLGKSILAVPPLARNADLGVSDAENQKLVNHLKQGGVSTFMYGGNANFYNISVGEYDGVLDQLESWVGEDDWVIPSIGADYGKALDQVKILKNRNFPTAMALPLNFPSTPKGVDQGLRRLADAYGKPLIVYVKSDNYLTPRHVADLLADGVACAVKYAAVRENPSIDAFLTELTGYAGTDRIISGIGERPAIEHLMEFKLTGFTSGSVCVAPALSTAMLHALQAGDVATATTIREKFIALEDLRDGFSPLRILHEAVRLAGIADTGPMYPFLSNIDDPKVLDDLETASKELLAANSAA
ncbi:dihydrodipicolinate synthase family protein [Thalassospira marina]|uniref:Dihydrodipicolinate synthase family protein n=1 Tax=Thalassospira marina TaxID=2048283 RepID=A0ABN5FMN1_9PROT|nr:dihydrodipicolinate synthase family protein [Thalassospira marina]AUG55553.1 dihydrodipicolinate synthase family protein [Thalassospira marina]